MSAIRQTLLDLFAFNAWANQKVLDLASELTAEQLSLRLPMGLETLSATLAHTAAAEMVWLKRWVGDPIDQQEFKRERTLPEIRELFQTADQGRRDFLMSRSDDQLFDKISYRTFAGDAASVPLALLATHVANHGIHHRSQALFFLKQSGKKVPGGLDYIFYKLAHPTLAITPDIAATMRGYGLEVGATLSDYQTHDRQLIAMLQAYGNWMMNTIFEQAQMLSDADLDRDFAMGAGSLRKTLLHMHDAENFWLKNYTGSNERFPHSPETTSISQLQESWQTMSANRASFLQSCTDADLAKPVGANFGVGIVHIRIGESMIQLAGHGTHHRAQAINMLKQLGKPIPGPSDFVVFAKDKQPERLPS